MSLAAPLFLTGLIALLLPWLLHRLNQHDAPVRDFPSDQFLQATTEVTSRKKRLRYLKLLALRLLLIVLLCLLFAEPAIRRAAQSLGETEKLHLIVLDKSFSMQQAGVWQQARQMVEDILDELPDSSSIQLFSAGAALNAESELTQDRQAVLAAMASVQPGYERLRYGDLVRQLSAQAEQTALPVVAHIISDMQASAIPVRANDLYSEALHEVILHDVSMSAAIGQHNAAVRTRIKPLNKTHFDLIAEIHQFAPSGEDKVSSVSSVDSVAQNATTSLDTNTAGNSSATSINGRRVSLYRAGTMIASKPLPSQLSSETLQIEFKALEWPAAATLEHFELKLTPADSLPLDDNDQIAVRKEPEVPIAIVSNATLQQRQQSVSQLYLKTALALDPRNLISLDKLDSLKPDNGLKLLIYLDNLALQDSALPTLPSALAGLRREGVHILYILNAATPRLQQVSEVVSVKTAHPIGLDVGTWQGVRFFAHQPLQTTPDHEVLLETDSHYPVLIERQPADTEQDWGRLMWLNAALNGADNTLPVSPVFVPFVRAVVDYFVRSQAYPTQLAVGEGIRLKNAAQLLDPAGNALLNLADRTRGKTQILSQPGIYTILEPQADIPVKVVVDIAESDLRHVGTRDIERWQSNISEKNPVETENTVTSAHSAEIGGTMLVLTRWLLPACLLLLVLESVYANWHLRTRRS